MFDTRKTLGSQVADAADLMIDFATLGEYGLEPVDRPAQTCEGRHRSPVSRKSTGSWSSAIDHFATQR
jgi:hypothetical protein